MLLPLDQVETVRRGARASDVERGLRADRLLPLPGGRATTATLVGYLHIKDVLQSDPHGRARVVEDKWIRPFADVRASDTLVSALQTLQAKGAHMARVVDDAGAVVGRGHPRGRHRGAGRRDPRRGPRRRALALRR